MFQGPTTEASKCSSVSGFVWSRNIPIFGSRKKGLAWRRGGCDLCLLELCNSEKNYNKVLGQGYSEEGKRRGKKGTLLKTNSLLLSSSPPLG